VNLPQTEADEKMVRETIARNRPAGSEVWVKRMADELDLSYTLRPRGRPVGWRKKSEKNAKEK
jgi:hypothetical protein